MHTPASLWWLRPICLFFALALSASLANAQTVFDRNGFGEGRGTYSALPYEHVDPLSGNLLIVTTDLVLPGNAGLDIRVQRVYNSAVYPNYANGGDKTLQEDSWAGVGWRLHFGRVIDATNMSSGGTQIEMGDGSRHPLYTDPAHPEGWITKDFWLYNRNTNTLKLPNGLVYTFGRTVVISPLGTVRYVTEIRDPHNNTITFDYFTTGPVDGVQRIRQDLGAGQVREVFFEYDPTLLSLKKMIYNGSEWIYTQTAFGANYNRLTSVKPPVGGAWSYGYETAPFVGLTSLTAPSGGVVSYAYADSTRTAGASTQFSRVVATRGISGPSITPGTWTFTYNFGPDKDQTVVDCPCGRTSYRYYGIGTGSGGFEAWRTGLLAERRVLGQFDAVLEREELTWVRSEPVSPDPVPAANGIWGDDKVYNALLSQRIIRRDAKSWTTTYSYRTGLGTYNDYGMPYRVTETDGARTRTTENTFRDGFTPYILRRLASSTVTLGAESAATTWTYESLTGFLQEQNVRGIRSFFARTANGNLGSVTDEHGHQTLFQYSWGAVSQAQTPLLTTTRTISPAGLVTRAQVGAQYTDYEYDLAFRPTVVKPAGGTNQIFYHYDGLWDGWYTVERGSADTKYTVDGFGRPIKTENQLHLKTLTGRDACGRVTFESLPFTDGQYDNRGTLTTYDALGRVTKSRFFDGIPGGGPDTAETNFAYDGLNVTATDPLGRITKQEYTAIGGPSDAVLTAVTDAANQQTFYTYDIANQLRQVSGAAAPRSWMYNAQGLLQQETQPESGTTTYEYDAAGLLKKVTDQQGQIFQFAYDANDRLLTRGTATTPDVTLTYDALGRLSTQQGGGVTTTYQYDTAGRHASRSDLFLGGTTTSSYAYDGNDNLTTLTYPSGRVVGYTYDVENRLTGITQNGAPFATGFAYDDGGGLKSYVTGAVTHQVDYDRRQRVKHLTAGAGTPALDLTYQYNTANQVMFINDSRVGWSWAFAYDNLNRLIAANGPYSILGWTYDGRGNRTSDTIFDATTTYTYNQSTQRLTSTSGAVNESFAYDALGRVTSDSRGAYTYTRDGQLASVSAPTVSAAYTYDADARRILRVVNGVHTYSFRSVGGQTLTEYEAPCGPMVFTRDLIYAGSRLVGVMKASSNQPTVAFTATQATVPEAAGTASVSVRVTTVSGAALSCPVSVSYRTTTASAMSGLDFTATAGTLTFPSGTASGTQQAIVVPIVPDARDEPSEALFVELTAASGATLGTSSYTVVIADDDPPPTLSIDNVTVSEAAGGATFTVSLSAPSALPVAISYATAPETAKNGVDYQPVSGQITIPAGQPSQTISVPLIDDTKAEPAETFVVQLSAPVNATIAQATGRATIADNERARAPIDLSLPGLFIADATSAAGYTDWVVVYNPNAVAVTVRVTYTRPDASGVVHHFYLPARTRFIINPYYQPDVGGEGEVSIAVQSTSVGYPLVVDHSQYAGPGAESGHSTRATEPAADWYFAEGAVNAFFDEYLTVYNPTSDPITVTADLVAALGTPVQHLTWTMNEAPGRLKVRLRDAGVGALEHGTILHARRQTDNALVPVVVERDSAWGTGAGIESVSSSGSSVTSTTWGFAEGAKGAYQTYLALMNPTATAAPIGVYWAYENSVFYGQSVTVPAMSRITVEPPAYLPAGGFAINIESPSVPIVAERSIYLGSNWEAGDSDIGAPNRSLHWKFADGATGAFFDTYLLLMNPFGTPAAVTITYRKEDGTTVTQNITVPNSSRYTVSVDSVPGMSDGGFAFDVDVTNGIPIVAERLMYWPGWGWTGSHVSLGRPQ